jgi:hypothetical protein
MVKNMNRLTLGSDLQRDHSLGFSMAVLCDHGIGAGEIEFGTRNFQAILGSVVYSAEMWRILVVIGLKHNEINHIKIHAKKNSTVKQTIRSLYIFRAAGRVVPRAY